MLDTASAATEWIAACDALRVIRTAATAKPHLLQRQSPSLHRGNFGDAIALFAPP
jgi:hypothetical protein